MIRKIIKKILPRFRLATLGSLNLANAQIEALQQTVQTLEAQRARIAPGEPYPTQVEQTMLRDRIALKWEILDAMDPLRFPAESNVSCRICGHTAQKNSFEKIVAHCVFGGGSLERFGCPSCGCIFGPLKVLSLTPKQLSDEYVRHYSVYAEGDSTEAELRAFRSLKPDRSGRYLNYGCGAWSRSIEVLRNEGYNVWGYEPYAPPSSPFIISSEAELEKEKFDGIFSNNLLEHLQDPVAYFEAMKSLVRPEASLAHATPCYYYAYDFTRFHLFFFTGHSINIICERTGYEVVSTAESDDKEYVNYVFRIKQ